jgi:hypothetical protein
MNRRTSFALILMLLPSVLLGCFFPLALGHSKVVVEGHLIGAITPGVKEEQISLYFCHSKPKRVITISGDGRFSEEFGYSYGGLYMFFPPLGEFPKQTPPPPNICISFPSEAGEYYLVRLDREGAKWRNFIGSQRIWETKPR